MDGFCTNKWRKVSKRGGVSYNMLAFAEICYLSVSPGTLMMFRVVGQHLGNTVRKRDYFP